MNTDIIIGIIVLLSALCFMITMIIFSTRRINKITKIGPSSSRELLRKLHGKN